MIWLAWLMACTEPSGATFAEGPPQCDGQQQEGESTTDAPFDADQDGFFDSSNVDCAATYDPRLLDCNDDDPAIHPDATEIRCTAVDEDCNPDTPDALDLDDDGSDECSDCDDSNPLRSPDFSETCADGIDNNCDDLIDDDCGPDYTGTFEVSDAFTYRCGLGAVKLDLSTLSVLHVDPALDITSIGAGPGSLAGTIDDSGAFRVEVFYSVGSFSCDELYVLEGQFIDADHFTADFTATYTGGSFVCGGCIDQAATVEAVRVPSP